MASEDPHPDASELLQHSAVLMPLWRHIQQQMDDFPDAYDSCETHPLASLRATCKSIHKQSFQHINNLPFLRLGQSNKDVAEASETFTEQAGEWAEEQRAQQDQVKAFLSQLPNLQKANFGLKDGGVSQLIQLLEQGAFPRTLDSLGLIG